MSKLGSRWLSAALLTWALAVVGAGAAGPVVEGPENPIGTITCMLDGGGSQCGSQPE